MEYDVVVGQLFSGAFVNVGAAVLEAVVFSVFLVVFKVSLYLAEAVGQVFLFSSWIEEKGLLSAAVVGLLTVRGKGKFGFMGIMVGLAVAEFINVLLKAFDIYIYVMGGLSFRGAQEGACGRMVYACNGAADVVHAITVKQLSHIGGCLSEVSINGIEFQGAVDKVVTAASYISDLVHVLIIFKNTH